MKKDNCLSDTELAYIAGIIDGEGCLIIIPHKITHTNSGYSMHCQLHISNTDEKLIDWLIVKLGGKKQIVKPRSPKHSVQYFVMLHAKTLRALLPKIKPFSIIKIEQIEILLEALSLTDRHTGKHAQDSKRLFELYEKLQALHNGKSRRSFTLGK
jgi:hypothetical protein